MNTTARQKAAVHFCEQWLDVTFNGNINDHKDVSPWLGLYLAEAKEAYNYAQECYEEARGEYESWLWEKDY